MAIKFFNLIILLTITSHIFSMEKSENKKYTVGMKIPNNTYANKPVNPVHMTLTYLGDADEKKLEEAKKILRIINELRPILVKFGKSDTFGTPERPVPVIRLLIENPKIEELLIQMHKELGVCEPFQAEKLEIPNWHVSVKDAQLQKEFSECQGKPVAGGKLFIKPLGNFDPIEELE